MHIRVKDMSRRQQRAVFANLTDGPTSFSGETKGNREQLARKGLSDSRQAKIDRIMSDKHLSHRQKMNRIARLNKSATLQGSGRSGSALIIKVPSGLDRQTFNKILIEKKQKGTNLYELNGLLLTQEEYKKGIGRPPKGSDVIDAPTGINRAVFNGLIAKRKPTPGTYIKTGGLALPMKDYREGILRDAKLRGKALKKPLVPRRVTEKELRTKFLGKKMQELGPTKVTRLPLPEQVKDPKKLPGSVGATKVTKIPLVQKLKTHLKTDPVTGKVHKEYFPSYANKSFKQLKKQGVKLKAKADTDKDGVPNAKDCKPLNPKEQGLLHDLASGAGKKIKGAAKEGVRLSKGAARDYYETHYTSEGKQRAASKEYLKYKELNRAAAIENKARREKEKYEKRRSAKWKKRGKAVKKLAKEAFQFGP